MFMPDYPIETERLRLRPFTRGDVDAVFSYRSREDVCRYLFDEPMSRETCAEAVRRGSGRWPSRPRATRSCSRSSGARLRA